MMDNKFYQEVSEALKSVSDITSRIDERMKILIENNNESRERIEKLMESQNTMFTRVGILETKNGSELKSDFKNLEQKVNFLSTKIDIMEKDFNHHSNNWKSIADFVFKVGVILVSGFLLWKFGLK